MKLGLTTIFFFFLIQVSAQDQLLLGTTAGVALGSEKTGSGYAYSIDVQKHLGLDIYSVINYEAGQLSLGETYYSGNSESSSFQTSKLGQYSSIGLGLRKSIQLSPKGSLGLQFSALWVKQNRIDWDLFIDDLGKVDLFDSQERYSRKTDLGYYISWQYMHRLNSVLRMGIAAGYRSHPKLFSVGLRAMATLGKPSDNVTSATESYHKNWLELRLGGLAGDGTNQVFNYTIVYGHKLRKKLSFYSKIAIGQGLEDGNEASIINNLSEEEIAIYNRLFLAEDNEAGTIWLEPTQSVIFGVGTKYQINADGQSALSLSVGFSYYLADESRFVSSGSKVEELSEQYFRHKKFLPELGLHYDYRFSDLFFFGGFAGFAFNRLNIEVGVHTGVYF